MIKHLYYKGLTSKEMEAEVYDMSVLLIAIVYNWVSEFRKPEYNRRIKAHEIVDTTGI